ncbi:MAG: efflux RND transporter permease subunit [Nitrospirales bacterium]
MRSRTDTAINIVSLLGGIIGIGVVAKNGILMLVMVHWFELKGDSQEDSWQRHLRPALMTSLTTALGLLPLAFGIGTVSDMLKPLSIGVIGALTLSVLFSLAATLTLYPVMRTLLGRRESIPCAS